MPRYIGVSALQRGGVVVFDDVADPAAGQPSHLLTLEAHRNERGLMVETTVHNNDRVILFRHPGVYYLPFKQTYLAKRDYSNER